MSKIVMKHHAEWLKGGGAVLYEDGFELVDDDDPREEYQF